jgi:hypothetical protein
MQKIFWMRYLSSVLVFAPLMSLRSIVAVAIPMHLAQAKSGYDEHMQLGYDATRQRNYSAALTYFKQALQENPGDRYAGVAVRNLEGYIARDRQDGSQARNSLAYISSSLGIPSRRVPGASRASSCLHSANSLTALTPQKNPALTTAGYPVFFFYIPQTSAQALELVLQDAKNDEQVYKATFKTSGEPGVVRLSLPANSTKSHLKAGKEYHWSFSVICDRQDRSQDMVVEGSIQRMVPDHNLTVELEKAAPRERAVLYATAGFWQDTLATLAQLRSSRPNDPQVTTDWKELLKSVGLEGIAQEPLVPCCTVP